MLNIISDLAKHKLLWMAVLCFILFSGIGNFLDIGIVASVCTHKSRMIAGQTISSRMAGLKECRNLSPSLSPISVSSLQTDVVRELFQPVQHLIALSSGISTLSLGSHPGESGKR